MIILDENFPDSQRQLLQGWRISFKQVGNSTPKKNYRSIGTNDLADKLSALTGLAPDLSTGGKRQLGGRLKGSGVVCRGRIAGDRWRTRHGVYEAKTAGYDEKRVVIQQVSRLIIVRWVSHPTLL